MIDGCDMTALSQILVKMSNNSYLRLQGAPPKCFMLPLCFGFISISLSWEMPRQGVSDARHWQPDMDFW